MFALKPGYLHLAFVILKYKSYPMSIFFVKRKQRQKMTKYNVKNGYEFTIIS